MRTLTVFLFSLLFTSTAIGQENAGTKKVKEDILKLFSDWNQARLTYDRAALEQIFADDYTFIHGHGFTDDKAATINDQLNTDSIQPVPVPDLGQLQVFNDVAILKRLIRGPQGSNYNTNVFIKKNGRWQFALSQTTLLQPERKTMETKAETLAAYTGKYESQGRLLSITNRSDTLVANIAKIPKRKLLPAANNIFFDKLGAEYKFMRNEKEEVTGLTIRPRFGPETQWRKIE